jgi:hypothetical protein
MRSDMRELGRSDHPSLQRVGRGTAHTGDSRIRNLSSQSSSALQQRLVVRQRVFGQPIFCGPSIAQVAHAVVYADVCWPAVQRRRECEISSFSRRRARLISGAAVNVSLELRSSRIVGTRCSISVDNSFTKQIVHRLARPGNVCGKQVVERAVFTQVEDRSVCGRKRSLSPILPHGMVRRLRQAALKLAAPLTQNRARIVFDCRWQMIRPQSTRKAQMKTILMLIVGLMLAGCGSMENHVRNRDAQPSGYGFTASDAIRDTAVDAICACP